MAAAPPMTAFPVAKTLKVLSNECYTKRTNLKSRSVINPARFRRSTTLRSSSPSSRVIDKFKDGEDSMSADVLRQFIKLNLGNWNGTFYQFDGSGNLLQHVTTRLATSSYGEDELISLIQTLYIKQPALGTPLSGSDEAEWTEYKIKETNMFTVDKYQQIGFFPDDKAFALRYQTAGMLETILRAGVLGDDDIGEESPKGLKIPSRKPSIVCENCLYSQKEEMRARAFHIMDPSGILEMLLVFLEQRADGTPNLHVEKTVEVFSDRLNPFLGQWEGYSKTKRTGLYGATVSPAETKVLLQMNNEGQLIQDITSASVKGTSNVRWTGTVSGNLVSFDGGFQMTVLPGGMYMACPQNLAKNVAESQSFHLEFCWMEHPDRRQRLVRTYDVDGLAVSSTYFYETKVRDA